MFKHLNPLEKEFLIRQYKSNYRIKMSDFCEANHISTGAFQKWIKQYDEGGLKGLARADSEIKDVLPEGIDRTEESYKREILKLRTENERCGGREQYLDGLADIVELLRGKKEPTIIHTDQGSVYSSKAYNELIQDRAQVAVFHSFHSRSKEEKGEVGFITLCRSIFQSVRYRDIRMQKC